MPLRSTLAYTLGFIGVIVPITLAGCGSAPTGAGGHALDAALNDYDAQRFERAQKAADTVATGPDRTLRGRGDYLCGLCAYRLGDNDEARRRLAAATTGLVGLEAAQAREALGLVNLALGRPAEAAEGFAAACPDLAGPDARQAALFAALAFEQAGDEQSAARWARIGCESSPPRRGGFTIQVGAFRDRDRAERAAVEAAEVAQDMGLAPIRIVTRTDHRRGVFYIVQLGSFQTRSEAAGARQRVGNLQYIVAAQPPS